MVPPSLLLPHLVLTAYGEPIAALAVDADDPILVTRWLGYCTPENVARVAPAVLLILHKHPCPAIISDGTAAMGDWSELVPWMQYDFMPRVLAAGVRYSANIPSADAGARLAHEAYGQMANQHMCHRLFHSMEEGRVWLRKCLARGAC